MRPGLTINLDHINRFDDYVRIMRASSLSEDWSLGVMEAYPDGRVMLPGRWAIVD